MKTYDYISYNGDWSKIISEFNQEVETKVPIKFKTKDKLGEITSIKASTTDSILTATLQIDNEESTIELHKLQFNKDFQFETAEYKLLTEILTTFRAANGGRIQYSSPAKFQAALEKIEEEKQKRETIRLKKIETDIRNFQNDCTRIASLAMSSDLAYSLGWLTSHSGTVSATLPSHLGPCFEKHFGADVPKTLREGTTHNNTSKNPMQITYSFRCGLTNLKSTLIPAYLQPFVGSTGNTLTNTAFVWTLVDKYGFRFGKTQDVKAIRSFIPASYLEYFDAGRAA